MNKITRKKYNIVNNVFVGVEHDILAYSVSCKYIHSMKQCLKRLEKQYKGLRKIKIQKDFLKEMIK